MPSSGPRASPARPAGVRGLGLRAGPRVHDHQGVQRGLGAGEVVGLDAVEVGLQELDGRGLARFEGGTELGNGRLDDVEAAHRGDLRLLLGDAVDPAAVGIDRPRVDRHRAAARVGSLQDLAGAGVGFLPAEAAGDDAAVDHEVVDVAVVHEAFLVPQDLRGRKLGDLEAAARGIGRRREQRAQVPGHLVVGVFGIALAVQQELARAR